MWLDVMITPLPRAERIEHVLMAFDVDTAQQLIAFEPRQSKELEQHAVVARHHLQNGAHAFAPRTARQDRREIDQRRVPTLRKEPQMRTSEAVGDDITESNRQRGGECREARK